MFAHLYNKAAVKMTEAEKQEYKESIYKLGWDGATELSAYFAELTRSEDTLPQQGLTIAAGNKGQWGQQCGGADSSPAYK